MVEPCAVRVELCRTVRRAVCGCQAKSEVMAKVGVTIYLVPGSPRTQESVVGRCIQSDHHERPQRGGPALLHDRRVKVEQAAEEGVCHACHDQERASAILRLRMRLRHHAREWCTCHSTSQPHIVNYIVATSIRFCVFAVFVHTPKTSALS